MHAPDLTLFQSKHFTVASDETHLRILQTTDIHVNLLPYNYFTDRPDPKIGLSQIAALIRTARKESPNTLLLDTGDFLQGTPLGDLYAEQNPQGGPRHPSIAAMNALAYDAGTVGNHEFNYGLDFLTSVLAGSGFPIVLANAATRLGDTPVQDDTLFQPYQILDRTVRDATGRDRHLKIGVIGFVPPQIAIWDRRHLENRLHMRGITEAARAYVPQMKAEGADLVIALSHSGIGLPEDIAWQENASVPLAAVEGIDVVLCGHQHRRFPGPHFGGIRAVDPERGTIHGKPAVMAGFWGSDLGVIDLALHQDRHGAWHLRRHRSFLRPIPVRSTRTDPLTRDLTPEHRATLSHIRTTVTTARQPLHSFFTYAGFDLATRAVALAQRDHARQLLGDQDLPILSAASPFRAGGHAGPDNYTHVAAGPVTLRNLADLYLFPNTLSVLRVTGAQLRDWLERAAGVFCDLVPGQADQPLLNPAFPSYNCDLILGLDYVLDLTQPSKFAVDGSLIHPRARRVTDLRHQGQPVRDDRVFLIATNSYRAGGGGAFAGTGPGDQVLATPQDIRTVMTGWARRQSGLNPDPVRNWRFAPVAGASAVLRSSPEAQTYLDQTPLPLTRIGPDADGFDLYRLTF